MIQLKPYEFWFITGSQHLYGPETLEEVNAHSSEIASSLSGDAAIPFPIVFKPVVTTPAEIRAILNAANADENCAGVITWMHTFSPAKMWITGLTELRKPLLHLHTQYNRDIPWDTIDMDFMNTNQAAHGDREYGFIGARLGISRKVVVGYWGDSSVRARIGEWERTAVAYNESRGLKVCRFGDNMRQVAVTEGDKVEAEIKFGWSVNTYGVGDLVQYVNAVSEAEVEKLLGEYAEKYEIAEAGRAAGPVRDAIAYQARLEIAIKRFLDEGGFTAFTTTFEDLHGLEQLPGLAVQRLMEQGYGFAGEGDWKTAALTRLLKIVAGGVRTSFMEDYTYHFEPGNEMVLGAHMLEVCPTLAETKPRIEVHPLGIGGKADPARIVFDGKAGSAINVSVVDLGNRFRLIVNEVQGVAVEKEMPKLPVARVLWKPEPSLHAGAEAWILAGGAHHTVYSLVVKTEQMLDLAELFNIEAVVIDKDTNTRQLKNELRFGQVAWAHR
ncbi:L-arabinose isomerase [Cohnella thailandensis]|uniref:L-arabinose isomerase n=1 Tax=Cohnella thailandensis TaxID=557557 RepID=A0A841SXE5_9BACL|nr:L-arabinose isomerase [Cohnella thailandensis]MBB6635589.1 L-arabinose isomerase [Cohnella thailandensis]MBP1974969.1 L-arabinose isomerase [Cohnella thailandensis]